MVFRRGGDQGDQGPSVGQERRVIGCRQRKARGGTPSERLPVGRRPPLPSLAGDRRVPQTAGRLVLAACYLPSRLPAPAMSALTPACLPWPASTARPMSMPAIRPPAISNAATLQQRCLPPPLSSLGLTSTLRQHGSVAIRRPRGRPRSIPIPRSQTPS